MAKTLTFEEFSHRTEYAKKLTNVERFITWRYVANKYFERSPAWFTGKLCGKDGNGNAIDFTDEEKLILKGALIDMADELRKTADSL